MNDLVEIDVMLVGTNDGKILKIVMTYNGTDHVPLISEELSVSANLHAIHIYIYIYYLLPMMGIITYRISTRPSSVNNILLVP